MNPWQLLKSKTEGPYPEEGQSVIVYEAFSLSQYTAYWSGEKWFYVAGQCGDIPPSVQITHWKHLDPNPGDILPGDALADALEAVERAGTDANGDEPLTLRDQFAMAALTGLIANSLCHFTGPWKLGVFRNQVAEDAYAIADAMLDERL